MKKPKKTKEWTIILRIDGYLQEIPKVRASSAKEAVKRVRKHIKTARHIDVTHVSGAL